MAAGRSGEQRKTQRSSQGMSERGGGGGGKKKKITKIVLIDFSTILDFL